MTTNSQNETEIFEKAKQESVQWVGNINFTGEYSIKAIQKALAKRKFEGEAVDLAFAVEGIQEAVDCLTKIPEMYPKKDQKEVWEVIKNARSCIWDYYLMAFYESGCSVLPNRDFEGSEFIYDSLFSAYQAGLGFLINLGPVLVGVARPKAFFDDQQRLHHPSKPALTWGKGVEEYWWHGVKVPSEWITSPDTQDPSLALTHPNVEERRAFAEIIGWDKVLDRLDPKVLDEDPNPEIGVLCEVDLPDHGKQRFLRVLEGSTGRRFALLASNNVSTAKEAQAEISQIPVELFDVVKYVRT